MDVHSHSKAAEIFRTYAQRLGGEKLVSEKWKRERVELRDERGGR